MLLLSTLLAAVNLYSPPVHGNQAEGTLITTVITVGFVLVVAAAASIKRSDR